MAMQFTAEECRRHMPSLYCQRENKWCKLCYNDALSLDHFFPHPRV